MVVVVEAAVEDALIEIPAALAGQHTAPTINSLGQTARRHADYVKLQQSRVESLVMQRWNDTNKE